MPGRAALRAAFSILRDAAERYDDHAGSLLAAALAFHAVFAAAPLFLVLASMAGLVVGEERALEYIAYELAPRLGPDTREMLDSLAAGLGSAGSGLAAVAGVLLAALTASRLFVAEQEVLGIIFGVPDEPFTNVRRAALRLLVERLASIAMILSTGVVFILFFAGRLVLETVLGLFGGAFDLPVAIRFVDGVGGLCTLALLVGIHFRIHSRKRVAVRSLVIGALVTAAGLEVGTLLSGIYLSQVSVASALGATGGIVVVLIWAQFSAYVFVGGAELTAGIDRAHPRWRPAETEVAAVEPAHAPGDETAAIEPTEACAPMEEVDVDDEGGARPPREQRDSDVA